MPLPTSLATVIVPPSCSTIFLEIASPSPRPRRFVVTKSSKICAEALRRDAAAGVVDPDLHAIAARLAGDHDQAARRGRLDRVQDQVAIDASEREDVPLDVRPSRASAPCAA